MVDVLLADKQRLFRDTMKIMIDEQDDLHVVGVADDGWEVLRQLPELIPDIVLMDMVLPKTDSLDTTHTIRTNHPNTKIILTARHVDKRQITRSMLAGANGFILKEIQCDDLFNTIRLVHHGQTVIADPFNEALKGYLAELLTNRYDIIADVLKRHDIYLTNREIAVVDLFRLGYDNQQIASRLHLKEGTVKNYISNIYSSIGIHNRKDAIAFFQDVLNYMIDWQ